MGMFLAPAMFVAPGGCLLRSAFQVDRVFGVTTLFLGKWFGIPIP